MNRWFLSAYLAYRLSRSFVNDWTLKIHFFKIRIYEPEVSKDFYLYWRASFILQISFPRPEIIIGPEEGYELARRVTRDTKGKASNIIRVWLWGMYDHPED